LDVVGAGIIAESFETAEQNFDEDKDFQVVTKM
jgi:hypothetical protein